MPDWFTRADLLLFSTLVLIVFFVGTLVGIPLLCVRLPDDYFVSPPPKRAGWVIALRTATAAVLIAMGLLMLLLPGQGLLTILLGVSLLDFPAKRRFERKLLRRGLVLRTINRIRKRANKPPLQPP